MKKTICAAAITLLAAAGAYAQGPGGPRSHNGFGPDPFGLGGFGHGGKVVTGAPYSATVTTQFTQTLSGGNTIQRTNTAQVARDDQGRTYEQQTITGGPLAQNGPVTLTFISDTVAGYSYVLNPQTKIATRHAIRTPSTDSAPAGTPPHPPRGEDSNTSANVNRAVADLGTQTINGVTAQGKSTTRTIAAGAVGNAQPIVSTSETWYSPDLQIIVVAKRSDPRMGQSTYAVTNIQRTEPAATLFQVPSDYTVQDAPSHRGPWAGPGAGGPPPQE
ncbi:MAG: hypothetical protein JO108_03540 [Acidobacteriaceae bacterium]|nr:hypothetical protein [Acidobacteriaceae bacterium]